MNPVIQLAVERDQNDSMEDSLQKRMVKISHGIKED